VFLPRFSISRIWPLSFWDRHDHGASYSTRRLKHKSTICKQPRPHISLPLPHASPDRLRSEPGIQSSMPHRNVTSHANSRDHYDYDSSSTQVCLRRVVKLRLPRATHNQMLLGVACVRVEATAATTATTTSSTSTATVVGAWHTSVLGSGGCTNRRVAGSR
jgi:hypothetical protein